jgi:hypothetical protein
MRASRQGVGRAASITPITSPSVVSRAAVSVVRIPSVWLGLTRRLNRSSVLIAYAIGSVARESNEAASSVVSGADSEIRVLFRPGTLRAGEESASSVGVASLTCYSLIGVMVIHHIQSGIDLESYARAAPSNQRSNGVFQTETRRLRPAVEVERIWLAVGAGPSAASDVGTLETTPHSGTPEPIIPGV